jgi:hypothetical protein
VPLAALILALAVVVLASRYVERLSVIVFWTLPYMVVNLPTGGFTLKLPEVMAYLFAAAYGARALIRRETPRWPPATAQVLVYLGVLAVSAAFAPPVPLPYAGVHGGLDRNSPDLRSISLIAWLLLAWLTVTAIYNVVGDKPELYKKCVCTYILSSGLASLVGIGMYIATLAGVSLTGIGRGMLVFNNAGAFLRLAGVAYEPMFMGFFLMTTIPVTLAVRRHFPHWIPNPLSLASLVLQCVAIALTTSGGGIFALIVALLLLTALTKAWRRSQRWLISVAAVAVALVVIGVTAYLSSPTFNTIVNITAGKWTTGSDSMRGAEAIVGWNCFVTHPILGVGAGMDNFYFPRYYRWEVNVATSLLPEINDLYITVAAETGLIGILAFAWMGLAGIRALAMTLRRHGPVNRPVLTALTCSLVGCAFQYLSLNPLFLLYFTALVGIACAGERLAPTGVEQPAAAGIRP